MTKSVIRLNGIEFTASWQCVTKRLFMKILDRYFAWTSTHIDVNI